MSKIYIQILAGLTVAAGAAAALAQNTVAAKFAGATVNLVIPKGHCVIPREDQLGALHYKLQEDGNQGRNQVAILFADCAEWAQRKANPALLLNHHGNYLFQLTQGQERLLPVTATRADIVKIYLDHELKSGGANNQDISERLKEKIAKSSVPSPELQGNVNLGLIDRDERAAYMGVGGTFNYDGKPVRFVGVTGATTTRAVPTTINLYGPAASGNPFRELLAQQRELVRRFVAANE
ncbi:hypothetical protein FN976_11105 [Caenimonas sedimenti]|uniref:Uncharacterized protein n=1 Tax=Caenimonas sedimenti TaxID=2596921 RepID=A0A562ZSW8_9BURK|nr:hypothetical protein [Caenimonas sedimenti]TWO71456.1 hypothetical protein FN976_11105 [Caenimonas sedimenti]